MPFVYTISLFGGINQYDQIDSLSRRSHVFTETGVEQLPNVATESSNMLNIDYDAFGIKKRKGATEIANSPTLETGDSLIGGYEFSNPTTGTTTEILVGALSMYQRQSNDGTWSVMQDSSNSGNFAHASTVTKVTFAETDGNLFIGTDGGNNAIQVWKGGTELLDQLRMDTNTTTVDASSSSGQKVLNVTATTMFVVNDQILIDGTETQTIASIQAGVSVTLYGNLDATYTNESVAVYNRYTSGKAATNTVTGTWTLGCYMVASIHSRLCYSKGNELVEYTSMAHTPSTGIHDLTGSVTTSGFFVAGGKIKMLTPYVPYLTDSLAESLYVGTSNGFEVYSGMTASDQVLKIEGARSPLNHLCFAKSQNWLIYATEDRNIIGINGAYVIDLGRRLRSPAEDGFLDDINVDTSVANNAYGLYDDEKRQAYLYFSSAGTTVNDQCAMFDFKLGEPLLGEALGNFEARVRCSPWQITTPSTNDWYAHAYLTRTGILGVMGTGKLYLTDSGIDDLIATGNTGNLLISAKWRTPIVFAGPQTIANIKQWLRFDLRMKSEGDWPITVNFYLDGNSASEATLTYSQVATDVARYDSAKYDQAVFLTSGFVRDSQDIDRQTEAIQFEIINETTEQTFTATAATLLYEIGALL